MKEKLTSLIKGFFTPDHLIKRVIIVVIACSFMALSASWLTLTSMGADTFTNLNQAISAKIGWSFGNWQALFNIILFIFVFIFGDSSNFGFGTLANMFLIGYEVDFFNKLWTIILPADLFNNLSMRIILMIPGLIIFVLSCAVYMDVELGTSPCDALSFIIKKRVLKNVSFKIIRMGYDFTLIIIAFLLNGKVYPITILMALTLGTTVEYVGKWMKSMF